MGVFAPMGDWTWMFQHNFFKMQFFGIPCEYFCMTAQKCENSDYRVKTSASKRKEFTGLLAKLNAVKL